ncbi:MAG: hypothetical protein H6686_13010 [Fibrobacteria bacterium]|nr:hypothetical protein [Fibrobacteria bacterium]
MPKPISTWRCLIAFSVVAMGTYSGCALGPRYYTVLDPMSSQVERNRESPGVADVGASYLGQHGEAIEVRVRIRNTSDSLLLVEPGAFTVQVTTADSQGYRRTITGKVLNQVSLIQQINLDRTRNKNLQNPYAKNGGDLILGLLNLAADIAASSRGGNNRQSSQDEEASWQDEERRRRNEQDFEAQRRSTDQQLSEELRYLQDRVWSRTEIPPGQSVEKSVLIVSHQDGVRLTLSVPVQREIHRLAFRQRKIELN